MSPSPKRHFTLLIVYAMLSLWTAAPCAAQEDPNHPAPWSGVGLDVTNNGRAHTYYYLLPTRRINLNQIRQVTLRVLARGAAVSAALVDRSPATTRTYFSCTATPSGSEQAEQSIRGQVRNPSPVLVISVPAATVHWSVMVEDQVVSHPVISPRIHQPTLSPSPTPDTSVPVPPVSDAAPWSGSLGGTIPEGHAPRYYYVDLPGGPVTINMSVTTSLSATVSFQVLDPHSPAPPDDFPAWSVSLIAGSTTGRPETTTHPPETRTLARGRYILKVQTESASRSSTYNIQLSF